MQTVHPPFTDVDHLIRKLLHVHCHHLLLLLMLNGCGVKSPFADVDTNILHALLNLQILRVPSFAQIKFIGIFFVEVSGLRLAAVSKDFGIPGTTWRRQP